MRVDTHDFLDRELGKAVPYGIYDVAANTGRVNVATHHDTAAFAVESIRRWWNGVGRTAYPTAGRLLITADAGGSNGYRTRTWKTELAGWRSCGGACHRDVQPLGTVRGRLSFGAWISWRLRSKINQCVRSSSSRRQVCTHRSMKAFMRVFGCR